MARKPLDQEAYWAPLAEPLWAFLATPRTWAELHKYRRKNKITIERLRNCLAYLDMEGRVQTKGKGDALQWCQKSTED